MPVNSYARGGRGNYDMGRSYGPGANYDMNSYRYYGPEYDQGWSMARGGRGYSMTGSKMDMVGELSKMMNETQDETVKKAISEAITKMNK